MRSPRFVMALAGLSVGVAHLAGAQSAAERPVLARIRDEGFHRSRVMEWASYIADVYGPRLAGSPSYRRAAKWAKEKLTELGLEHAAVEPWGEYGMGWESNYTSIHLVAPEYQAIIGYPRT